MTQRAYWDRAAATKTFTHELGSDWLELITDDARVLDYGCGYGRTLRTLAAMGKSGTVGYDFSERMVARGKAEDHTLDLRYLSSLPIPEPDQTVDAALLLAVLTCVPYDSDQDAIMQEMYRVLKPDGLLMLSDMPLQTDERNTARYAASLNKFGMHGVFASEDGAVVRHHSCERLSYLLRRFRIVEKRSVMLATMNGHAAVGVQVLALRPA